MCDLHPPLVPPGVFPSCRGAGCAGSAVEDPPVGGGGCVV